MIEARKSGLFIDGKKYREDDKRLFNLGWEIDLNQDDMPIINRYFSIRLNSAGEVYLYDALSSAYDGFEGVRQRIITGKDFSTLLDVVLKKYNECSDDISGYWMGYNWSACDSSESPERESILAHFSGAGQFPGSSDEMKKISLFESSSVNCECRDSLRMLIAYLGGVALSE